MYDKVRSNIIEVKARGRLIIGVISEDDHNLSTWWTTPSASPHHGLMPISASVPLQLLAN